MEKLLIIGEELSKDVGVRALAEHEEYVLLSAKDGAEGLALLQSAGPSVVMVDHELPGSESGLGILREVRRLHLAVDVILVTHGGEMDAAIEALRAGALDYLRRPLDTEQLRIALGRARERNHQRAAIEPPVILLLDDHQPSLARLTQVLTKEGYRVHAVGDGEAGLRLFREKRFDLILADLRMPGKDGLEVLRETKGKGADVEVIVFTGHGDEDVVAEALRAGAINFLKKPIDIEQMLLAIEKALEFLTIRRSLAFRNRDVAIMQELVIRLNGKLELIVQTPEQLSPAALGFLREIVDVLPFGIVVAGADKTVMFANRHVTDKAANPAAPTITVDWLRPMGIAGVSQAEFDEVFTRTLRAAPGTVETIHTTQWAFLVMTPLTLVRPDSTQRFVALAIRGERHPTPHS